MVLKLTDLHTFQQLSNAVKHKIKEPEFQVIRSILKDQLLW